MTDADAVPDSPAPAAQDIKKLLALTPGAKGRIQLDAEWEISLDGQSVMVRLGDKPPKMFPLAVFQLFAPMMQALAFKLGGEVKDESLKIVEVTK